MPTPEGDIKKKVLAYLRSRGHWVLPHATVGIFYARIGKHKKTNPDSCTRGEPDILVFAKSSPISPIWLELKSSRGRLSPDQLLFVEKAIEWGHEYLIVRSVVDCEKFGL